MYLYHNPVESAVFFKAVKNHFTAALTDIYGAALLTSDNIDPGILSDVFHNKQMNTVRQFLQDYKFPVVLKHPINAFCYLTLRDYHTPV